MYGYVKSRPLILVDPWGLLDLLVFDGRRLNGYDGADIEFNVPATSGPWGKGRLPAGTYRGENLRRRTHKAMVCEGGDGWSLNLDPTFKTDRDLLRIHPDGNKPGTKGCIGPDCRYQQQVYDALKEYFNDKRNKQIPVVVVYPK